MPTEANWYHVNRAHVRRSEGKSFVGLISYITGVALKDDRTGTWCTRNHPGEVLGWGIEAPPHAPPYLTDKAEIAKSTNDVERSEKRLNSHVGEHLNVAASREFSQSDHYEVARLIAERLTARYGVLTVWGIHKPTEHGDDRNWHYHFGFNMRRVDEDGFGEKVREITAAATMEAELRWMREMVARTLNDRLELIGSAERVSHLSYKERGVEKTATKHLGNEANQMELRGARTEIGDFNRSVRDANRSVNAAKTETSTSIARLEAEIIDLLAEKEKRKAKGREQMDYEQKSSIEGLEEQDKRIRMMQRTRERNDEYIREWQSGAEQAKKDQQRLEEARRAKEQEGGITDVRSRFAQAAGQHYDIRDPYRSMAKVVTEEHAQYRREQDDLKKQIAEAQDPDKRRSLQLKHDIQHSDYMQITSERLAGMSYVITGNRGADSQHARDAKAAKEWQERGRALRQEYRDHDKAMREQTVEKFAQQRQQMEREVRGKGTTQQTKDRSEPERPAEVRRDTAKQAEPAQGDARKETYKGRELSDDQQRKMTSVNEAWERSKIENPGQVREQQKARGGQSR